MPSPKSAPLKVPRGRVGRDPAFLRGSPRRDGGVDLGRDKEPKKEKITRRSRAPLRLRSVVTYRPAKKRPAARSVETLGAKSKSAGGAGPLSRVVPVDFSTGPSPEVRLHEPQDPGMFTQNWSTTFYGLDDSTWHLLDIKRFNDRVHEKWGKIFAESP
jgi:hypothetical protein